MAKTPLEKQLEKQMRQEKQLADRKRREDQQAARKRSRRGTETSHTRTCRNHYQWSEDYRRFSYNGLNFRRNTKMLIRL